MLFKYVHTVYYNHTAWRMYVCMRVSVRERECETVPNIPVKAEGGKKIIKIQLKMSTFRV